MTCRDVSVAVLGTVLILDYKYYEYITRNYPLVHTRAYARASTQAQAPGGASRAAEMGLQATRPGAGPQRWRPACRRAF